MDGRERSHAEPALERWMKPDRPRAIDATIDYFGGSPRVPDGPPPRRPASEAGRQRLSVAA